METTSWLVTTAAIVDKITESMTTIEIVSWGMTTLTIIGTIANSFQKRAGFYFWLISNLFWIGYNIYNKMYAQAAVYAFNSLMCVVGLVKWKKTEMRDNNVQGRC